MAVRKPRMRNMIDSEKTLLVDLATKYFNIIENKKTDGVTSQRKQEQWEEISVEFNSMSQIHYRNATDLKNSWDNLKRLAKRTRTEEKFEFKVTGN